MTAPQTEVQRGMKSSERLIRRPPTGSEQLGLFTDN